MKEIPIVILNLFSKYNAQLTDEIMVVINKWLLLKVNELFSKGTYDKTKDSEVLECVIKDIFGNNCTINDLDVDLLQMLSVVLLCQRGDPNLELLIEVFGPISRDELEDNIWAYYMSHTK